MADYRTSPARLVKRCSERHRLEGELLAMAYEQLWPIVRRPQRRDAANADSTRRCPVGATLPTARRA